MTTGVVGLPAGRGWYTRAAGGALRRFALTNPEALDRFEPQRRFVMLGSGAMFVIGGLATLAMG